MRRTLYTDKGIKRCKCTRCGKPAVHQWSACAVGNKWMPLCTQCDVGLNEVALTYVLGKDKTADLIKSYRERQA